jgi:hypothetical protein
LDLITLLFHFCAVYNNKSSYNNHTKAPWMIHPGGF